MGTATARTAADAQHIQYKVFSTSTYARKKCCPIMASEVNEIFPFTTFELSADQETANLTYSNTEFQIAPLGNYTRITIPDVDWFTFDGITNYFNEYAISTKAAMMSFLYKNTPKYVSICFGKTSSNTDCLAIQSDKYSDDTQMLMKYSFGTTMLGDCLIRNENSCSGRVILIPYCSNDGTQEMEGIYDVLCGTDLHGFYEINDTLFFISAGLAIKDE